MQGSGSGSDGGDGCRKTQGMAAAELDSGRGCSGSFRARWEGENMKWHVGQTPPLFL